MVTNITSKETLNGSTSTLSSDVETLQENIDSINNILSNIPSYDGINVQATGNLLASNFSAVMNDIDVTVKNISSYLTQLYQIDDNTKDVVTLESLDLADLEEPEAPAPEVPTIPADQTQEVPSYTGPTGGPTGGQTGGTTGSPTGGTTGGPTGGTTGGPTGGTTDGPTGGSNPSDNTPPSEPDPTEGGTPTPAPQPGDSNIDVTIYSNLPEKGFVVTTGNTVYQVSDADFNLLCAIVAAESDKTFDDALAVITTILNRCEAPNWVASFGTNPVKQATAPNQFVVYQHGSYKKYMGNAPDTVIRAVTDALNGVRNHNYLSFRSNGSTKYSNNMISPTGNRYK